MPTGGDWGNGLWGGRSHLASIVVDDEASTPAVEVFMGTHSPLQLLQQRLVGATACGVHSGTHVVQDTHDAQGVLWSWRGGSRSASPYSAQIPLQGLSLG